MHKHIILAAALAAALAAPLGASASSISGCFGIGPFCFPDPDDEDRTSTNFDLGVDVSDVPTTKAAVGQFLASLSPQGQQVMLRTCTHYLESPTQVQSIYTLPFCRVVVGR